MVEIRVIYFPDNLSSSEQLFADNLQAVNKEGSPGASHSQVRYMFEPAVLLSLEGLDSGKMEIIAYKKKPVLIGKKRFTVSSLLLPIPRPLPWNGREEGWEEGKEEMVISMYNAGADMDFIVKTSGFTKERIETILKKR